MRSLRFALCALCLPVAAAYAAGDDDQPKQAPEEIPNFNQLDEYVYVPKSTLSLGTRYFLKGPKASFWGTGSNPSPVNPGNGAPSSVPNISRTYIDGSVLPDSRVEKTNGALGTAQDVGIPSDGRTNTWGYDLQSQLLPNGDITFHTYSAQINDPTEHTAAGAPTEGVELIMDRDMGKLGKHFKWSLTAGFSIADIHSSEYAEVPTMVTTVTDTYDLFGQVPPAAPFNSPTTTTEYTLNQGGQTIASSSSGSASQTQSANQVILLGDHPISSVSNSELVLTQNRYYAEGAYYTLRAGPTVILPVGKKLEIDFSAGPALIYAGDLYNVLEDFQVATGLDFKYLYQKENSKLLFGYYADVNLKYQLTDTAGFYVGAMAQGAAGNFSQTLPSGTDAGGNPLAYNARFDFSGQESLKTGITVRF